MSERRSRPDDTEINRDRRGAIDCETGFLRRGLSFDMLRAEGAADGLMKQFLAIAISAIGFLGTCGLVRGQEGIEGNWFVVWSDTPEPGQTEKAILTLRKPWTSTAVRDESGARYWTYGRVEEDDWTLSGYLGEHYDSGYTAVTPKVSPNGRIEIEHPFFVLGHWGGESAVEPAGPDTITGSWSYHDAGGAERWRRAIPKITRVKFISDVEHELDFDAGLGRVEKSYSDYWWGPSNDMRGNRPSFWVEVYGENLWGHHVANIVDEPDLEPLGSSYIWDETADVPQHIVGLKFQIVIWPQFAPGRKTLLVDDMPIPFDLIVHGYAEEESPFELRFVRRDGAVYEEITGEVLPYGAAIAVELQFASDRDEAEKTVELEWDTGEDTSAEAEIVAKPVPQNPRLYRSEPFYLLPPPIPLDLVCPDDGVAAPTPGIEP